MIEPTERLYFTDSTIMEFEAKVLGVVSTDDGDRVVLNRTAFYPTGGGQPNDTGRLNDAEVVDVLEDESGGIIHLTKKHGGFEPGQTIRGVIDRARRLDHIQQHSGQHILSQAFIRACGAQTNSFHLGSETSTIDIDLQTPTDDIIRAAEEIANAVVFEDRPMRVHMISEAEMADLPLRKETKIRGQVRVIEVENFDWSPCGGTHAARTGEIGLIAIKSYEKAKKMTRVEFACGSRALADYRQANRTAVAVARLFSADRDSSPELVAKTIEQNKSLKKRVSELLELALTAEAARRLFEATLSGGFKTVTAVFENRDAGELRVLASKIVALEPSVVLLGSRDAGGARLVYARSASLAQNAAELMAASCAMLGGRGGGRPDLAQGGGPAAERLDDVIRMAAEKVSSRAERHAARNSLSFPSSS